MKGVGEWVKWRDKMTREMRRRRVNARSFMRSFFSLSLALFQKQNTRPETGPSLAAGAAGAAGGGCETAVGHGIDEFVQLPW